MKNKITMIEESLYEFKRRGRPRKIKIHDPDLISQKDVDSFQAQPEEITSIDVSDMSDAEDIEIKDEEDAFDDELEKALINEIKIPEFNRRVLSFYVKNKQNVIYNGVPMAALSNHAFLFKLEDGTLKKFFLHNIVPVE